MVNAFQGCHVLHMHVVTFKWENYHFTRPTPQYFLYSSFALTGCERIFWPTIRSQAPAYRLSIPMSTAVYGRTSRRKLGPKVATLLTVADRVRLQSATTGTSSDTILATVAITVPQQTKRHRPQQLS